MDRQLYDGQVLTMGIKREKVPFWSAGKPNRLKNALWGIFQLESVAKVFVCIIEFKNFATGEYKSQIKAKIIDPCQVGSTGRWLWSHKSPRQRWGWLKATSSSQ
jgi:hypothetical protein